MKNTVLEEDIQRIATSKIDWSQFGNKKVLITGATGLIGNQLLLGLVEGTSQRGLKVDFSITYRNKEKLSSRLPPTILEKQIKFIRSDLSGEIPHTDEYDFIFHCASKCTPSAYGTDPVGVILPNAIGTANLLKLCKKKTGYFVFLSSAEVCGNTEEYPIHEDSYTSIDPTSLRSCYAESKRAGEAICVAWSHQFEVQTRILRLFHTYGPGMSLGDGRVFSDFVKNALYDEKITIKSNGLATRSYCYVTDVVVGILISLFNGKSSTPYNIGNPDAELTVAELAKLIASISGNKDVIYDETNINPGYIKSHLHRSSPNISRMRDLGWSPSTSPKEGFIRTIESFLIRK